jgi:hypothetical protein
MPQGDLRGAGWEFFDSTYDGHWDGELRRGLGQLTDGKVGPDNFKMGYYDYERGTSLITCHHLQIAHNATHALTSLHHCLVLNFSPRSVYVPTGN